jgi:hypothetical protein
LERIANLCSDLFVSAEEYDRLSGFVPFPVSRYRADDERAVVFWLPSVRTWRKLMWTAGFDRVETLGKFKMQSAQGFAVRHVVHHCRKG